PEPAPVGERPAQFHIEALVVEGAGVVAFDVVVEVELQTSGQADLDFLEQAMRERAIAVMLDPPPALDARLPGLLLDVNARAGEAPGAGPLGALRYADARFFVEHGGEAGDGCFRQARGFVGEEGS